MTKRYVFRSKLRNRKPARAIVLGLAASVALAPAAIPQSLPHSLANASINPDRGSAFPTDTTTSSSGPRMSRLLNATAPRSF